LEGGWPGDKYLRCGVAKIVHVPSEFIAPIEPELTGTLQGDKSETAVYDNIKMMSEKMVVILFKEGIRGTLTWFGPDEKHRGVNDG
jgi:hypothetical protein